MSEKISFKLSSATVTPKSISGIWLLVGLVGSLLSPHNRCFFTASLCEDFSDLTSPTSNHIHLAISVVNDT